MDATRPRRTRNRSCQAWYAHWRSVRFARHMGFLSSTEDPQPKGRPCTILEDFSPYSSMFLAGGVLCYAAYLGMVWPSLHWASLAWSASELSWRRAA